MPFVENSGGGGSGATPTLASVLTAGNTASGQNIIGVGELAVTGLTGATAASRYVGATTAGPPASGTFAVGDHVVDQQGFTWVCITAGTPGTWVVPSGSAGLGF